MTSKQKKKLDNIRHYFERKHFMIILYQNEFNVILVVITLKIYYNISVKGTD
jgi:hypothetical protein